MFFLNWPFYVKSSFAILVNKYTVVTNFQFNGSGSEIVNKHKQNAVAVRQQLSLQTTDVAVPRVRFIISKVLIPAQKLKKKRGFSSLVQTFSQQYQCYDKKE